MSERTPRLHTLLQPLATTGMQVIAETSKVALHRGGTYRHSFVISFGFSFGAAVTEGSVEPLAMGIASDMADGSTADENVGSGTASAPGSADSATYDARVKLYGEAMAAAAGGGQSGKDALATATAYVYCSGKSAYAEAWAAAYAEVLRVDTNGCLILEVSYCRHGHGDHHSLLVHTLAHLMPAFDCLHALPFCLEQTQLWGLAASEQAAGIGHDTSHCTSACSCTGCLQQQMRRMCTFTTPPVSLAHLLIHHLLYQSAYSIRVHVVLTQLFFSLLLLFLLHLLLLLLPLLPLVLAPCTEGIRCCSCNVC